MNSASRHRPWLQIPLALACAVLALAWPNWRSTLRAETMHDHEQCVSVKDPLRLTGFVDISSRLGELSGCKISRSAYLCTPAAKTATIAFDRRTPIDPLPVDGTPVFGDRVCYKVRCPEPDDTASAIVTDEFAPRRLTKLKTRLLCAPTSEAAPSCETACCYLFPNFFSPPFSSETGCFEYTGGADQASAFMAQCNAGSSSPFGFVRGFAVAGACSVSPMTGLQCVAGQTSNAVTIPHDSRCGG